MKKSERDHSRWLDDLMTDTERRDFEATLDPVTLRKGAEWRALREKVIRPSSRMACPNGDFFNTRVMEKIRALEDRPPTRPPSIASLIWVGATCLFAAALISVCLLPAAFRVRSESEFLSQVVSARAENPSISAYAFQAPNDRGAVIWIEGADFIPAGENVR
jgi:hypothetical protein